MDLMVLVVSRRCPEDGPVLAETLYLLARRGWGIHVASPDELLLEPDELALEHDLYVLKSQTELSLNLACLLSDEGAKVLHPYANSIAAQDKILAQQRLRAAGLPVPRSWITADLTLLQPLVEEQPLIIKPHQGYRGQGIQIVRNRAELTRVAEPEKPVLIQKHVPGSGQDLKTYVIGGEVFAVHKPHSATSFTQAGTPCRASPEVRDIALRCGEVLGLGLYGVDMVESAEGPVVVDVNYFPSFRGVPDAAPLVADYIDGYARDRFTLRLPDLPGARRPVPAPAPQPALAAAG